MTKSFLFNSVFLLIILSSCNFNQDQDNSNRKRTKAVKQSFPNYTYSAKNSIPDSTDLDMPEDGVGLPDGRIIVADNQVGLRAILKDGSTRPFGNMKNAGYSDAGARGVFLENNDEFILVSCINSGEIYRVDVRNEISEVIFQHTYGVNNIYVDRKGDIWFTQSAENPNGTFAALDKAFANPIPGGAVFRLQKQDKMGEYKAKMMADSLFFANGISMDETEEHVFVAELRMDRILRFKIENDSLVDKEQYSIILSPDNLERDQNGNIWVASLIQNKVFAIDKKDRSRHEVFSAKSEMNQQKQQEWVRKTHLGQSLGDIGHPKMWEPLTGPLTGLFWSYDQKEVYFTGLGSKIIRFPFQDFQN